MLMTRDRPASRSRTTDQMPWPMRMLQEELGRHQDRARARDGRRDPGIAQADREPRGRRVGCATGGGRGPVPAPRGGRRAARDRAPCPRWSIWVRPGQPRHDLLRGGLGSAGGACWNTVGRPRWDRPRALPGWGLSRSPRSVSAGPGRAPMGEVSLPGTTAGVRSAYGLGPDR